MNNAVFAIPGLMPPKAPNFIARYAAPEDGSLVMLLHVGKSTDKVYFSICVPGLRKGTINDPAYYRDKGYNETILKRTEQYAEFLHKYDHLPEDAIVPRKIIQDWPVPITELTCVPEAERTYWVLELPQFALPIGDSTVQASINNRVVEYVVSRPDFGAHHHCDDISMRYKKYKEQVAEEEPQS